MPVYCMITRVIIYREYFDFFFSITGFWFIRGVLVKSLEREGIPKWRLYDHTPSRLSVGFTSFFEAFVLLLLAEPTSGCYLLQNTFLCLSDRGL